MVCICSLVGPTESVKNCTLICVHPLEEGKHQARALPDVRRLSDLHWVTMLNFNAQIHHSSSRAA